MRLMKWTGFAVLLAGALACGGIMVSALAMAGSRDVAAERTLQAKQVAALVSKEPAHLYLTIAVGIGQDNPAYVPSDFSVPRNSLVEVTITNFDDATPLTGSFVKYATVTGTIGGTASVTPVNTADPNGPGVGPTQVIRKMDPNLVSHTFTVPQLGLNVPIWPHARTTFTFRTGDAGAYSWACYDPCGGAMGTPRYMSGLLHVV
jgi:hypothetical protein